MDSFPVPITALVTIILSAVALAVTYADSEFWNDERPDYKKGGDKLHATRSERLVARFIYGGGQTQFEDIEKEMKYYYGDKADELLLMIVDEKLLDEKDRRNKRLHNLRGFVLRALGREEEANDAFEKALTATSGVFTNKPEFTIRHLGGASC